MLRSVNWESMMMSVCIEGKSSIHHFVALQGMDVNGYRCLLGSFFKGLVLGQSQLIITYECNLVTSLHPCKQTSSETVLYSTHLVALISEIHLPIMLDASLFFWGECFSKDHTFF